MKKICKELYDDFNVPINNREYLELGGFVITILIFLTVIFIVNEFIPIF